MSEAAISKLPEQDERNSMLLGEVDFKSDSCKTVDELYRTLVTPLEITENNTKPIEAKMEVGNKTIQIVPHITFTGKGPEETCFEVRFSDDKGDDLLFFVRNSDGDNDIERLFETDTELLPENVQLMDGSRATRKEVVPMAATGLDRVNFDEEIRFFADHAKNDPTKTSPGVIRFPSP